MPLGLRQVLLIAGCLAACAGVEAGQPSAAPQPATVSRAIPVLGYQVGGRIAIVDLKSTPILPGAKGTAGVRARQGVTNIRVSVKGLAPPTHFGPEFLAYVLWAVAPDGKTVNLGEIGSSQSRGGRLVANTEFQTFGLLVTVEPHFAVRRPSELVVLENQVREGKGKVVQQAAVKDYQLLGRAQYERLSNPLALVPDLKRVPLDVYQARNAVGMSRTAAVDKYAADVLGRAQSTLQATEELLTNKAGKKQVIASARQAVQLAEDARAQAETRQNDERLAAERDVAVARARADEVAKAAAVAAAADAAKRRAEADARAQAELTATREQLLKGEADSVRFREDSSRAEADRVRRAAEGQRTVLLRRLLGVLETRDTPRGLIVTLPDALFAAGAVMLLPAGREKLAQVADVVRPYSGLTFDVEGHTDNAGRDAVNLQRSRRRAETVRTFLASQRLAPVGITARGLGKAGPVAANSTAAGRRKNRRVEIVVSGEIIGARAGR